MKDIEKKILSYKSILDNHEKELLEMQTSEGKKNYYSDYRTQRFIEGQRSFIPDSTIDQIYFDKIYSLKKDIRIYKSKLNDAYEVKRKIDAYSSFCKNYDYSVILLGKELEAIYNYIKNISEQEELFNYDECLLSDVFAHSGDISGDIYIRTKKNIRFEFTIKENASDRYYIYSLDIKKAMNIILTESLGDSIVKEIHKRANESPLPEEFDVDEMYMRDDKYGYFPHIIFYYKSHNVIDFFNLYKSILEYYNHRHYHFQQEDEFELFMKEELKLSDRLKNFLFENLIEVVGLQV